MLVTSQDGIVVSWGVLAVISYYLNCAKKQ